MNLREEILKVRTRRQLFKDSVTGLGTIALASLLNEDLFGRDRARARRSACAPRRRISPHGPRTSSTCTWPAPRRRSTCSTTSRSSTSSTARSAPIRTSGASSSRSSRGKPKLLGSPHRFAPRGESGQVMSDVLPHLATVADDIAVVRSMYTDQFNHAPAQLFIHTGSARLGRPSMGSWLSYGLGTENRDLPSFVVWSRAPRRRTAAPRSGAAPSCRRSTRGCNCGPRAIRCSSSRTPPA